VQLDFALFAAGALAVALLLLVLVAGWRLVVRLRAGERDWPTWGLAGTACLVVAAGVAAAITEQALRAGATESMVQLAPAVVLEVGLLLALLGGWILDDAQRRHRHLHSLVQDRDRQLKDSEDSFLSVVEAAPEGFLILSAAGRRILASNPRFAEWIGRERDELETLRLDDLLPASDGNGAEEVLRRSTDPRSRADRFVLFQAAGGLAEAELSGTSVVFRGRPAVVLMVRDVSLLERARRAAQAASEAKNEFLTNVSQEIRTPLNGILGLAQLSMEEPLSLQLEENMATIRSCARDLLAVVDEALDVARMEAGEVTLSEIEFDPRAMVADVVRYLAPRARAKRLVLADVTRRDVPARLVGDVTRIGKILLTLIGNAIKYTEQGEIAVRIAPHGPAQNGALRLRLAVSDTGCGIEPELHERIFEPFQRGDTPRSRRQGGTGLGLALVRQMVDALGGRCRVDSTVGAGATFTVVLPLRLPQGATPPAPAEHLLGRGALVLHPSAVARESVSESLLVLGVRTVTVGGFDAALEQVRRAHREESPPDVLIVDTALLDERPALMGLLREAGPGVAVLALGVDARYDWPAPARGGIVLPAGPQAVCEALEAALDVRPVQDGGAALPAHTPRILVAEDNPVNQRLIVMTLERAGFETIGALDGRQALQLLSAETVDLVLMDVQMPELDGLEATRQLRQQLGLVDLPVIALTAHARSEDRESCLQAGMNDFLAKPVERDELLSMVARWIAAPVAAGPD
jgi:PAS domain S-box-containing protein